MAGLALRPPPLPEFHLLLCRPAADGAHKRANDLASAVRAASGLPPGEWIRARVILEAQCLLATTTRAVKEIAAELGYDDEAYFSRLFKKSVGVSPRDYQLGAAA